MSNEVIRPTDLHSRLIQVFPYAKDAMDLPLITEFSREITQRVPDVVSGLLWGSAAIGGFDPDRSDIDYMLVIKSGDYESSGRKRLLCFKRVNADIGTIESAMVTSGSAKLHHFDSRPFSMLEEEVTQYLYPFLSKIVIMVETGSFRTFIGKDFRQYVPLYSKEELEKDVYFHMDSYREKMENIPPFITSQTKQLAFVVKRAVYFMRLAQLELLGKIPSSQTDILEGASALGFEWSCIIPEIIRLFECKFDIPGYPTETLAALFVRLMDKTMEAIRAKGIMLTPEEKTARYLMLQHSRSLDKHRKAYLSMDRDVPTLTKLMTGCGYVDVVFAYQNMRNTFLSFLYPEDHDELDKLEAENMDNRDVNQLMQFPSRHPLRFFLHDRIAPYLTGKDLGFLNQVYEEWYAPAIEDFLYWYSINRKDRLRLGMLP